MESKDHICFQISREFPYGRKFVVDIVTEEGEVKGRVVCEDKMELMDALDQAIDDDSNEINTNFGEN